jgi:hypothetical protein
MKAERDMAICSASSYTGEFEAQERKAALLEAWDELKQQLRVLLEAEEAARRLRKAFEGTFVRCVERLRRLEDEEMLGEYCFRMGRAFQHLTDFSGRPIMSDAEERMGLQTQMNHILNGEQGAEARRVLVNLLRHNPGLIRERLEQWRREQDG